MAPAAVQARERRAAKTAAGGVHEEAARIATQTLADREAEALEMLTHAAARPIRVLRPDSPEPLIQEPVKIDPEPVTLAVVTKRRRARTPGVTARRLLLNQQKRGGWISDAGIEHITQLARLAFRRAAAMLARQRSMRSSALVLELRTTEAPLTLDRAQVERKVLARGEPAARAADGQRRGRTTTPPRGAGRTVALFSRWQGVSLRR